MNRSFVIAIVVAAFFALITVSASYSAPPRKAFPASACLFTRADLAQHVKHPGPLLRKVCESPVRYSDIRDHLRKLR